MANQEHLDILKQGVEVWNRWREEYLEIQPDLSEATLNGANLSGANLTQATFTGADLIDTNLVGANLSLAYLGEAWLIGANLSSTNLTEANFKNAWLSEADLSGAHLREADLSGAFIIGTIFGDVDLSVVKGLEMVKHMGKSYIDIHTIYRSGGNISEAFLRGIGTPETMIEYMRSLVGKPIDYYTCFISYSSKDEAFVTRLHADLQQRGVRCWFAPEDLKIGDHYHQRIDESIRLYDKLILILSEHAVQSAWVEREVVAAREKEDREQRPVLFPLRLDDAVMDTTKAWAADVRRRWHIGDFTQWKDHDTYQQAFERLLRDLKARSEC